MLRNVLHILISTYLIGCWAAPPTSWTKPMSIASIKALVKLPKTSVNIDNQNFKFDIDDAIGLFEVTSTGLACAGYGTPDPSSDTIAFKIFKDTVNKSDVDNKFVFYIWDDDQQCQVELQETANISSATITSDKTIYVDKLEGTKPVINYTNDTLYTSVSQATPTQSGINHYLPIKYQIIEAKYGIDSLTGTLYPSALPEGIYYIKLGTLACLANTLLKINILNSNPRVLDSTEVKNMSFSVEQPDCFKQGSITMTSSSVSFSNASINLVDVNTQKTYGPTVGTTFSDLPEGSYKPVLHNGINVVDYPNTIKLESTCQTQKSDIIDSQNTNNQINGTGIASIYNREGLLVKHIQLPGVWDGTDDQGKWMPTGEYYVYLDGKKIKSITVLK